MGIRTRRTTSKNPPIFSHEFIIQNHADIVSCVAMVFVLGLLFQLTSSVASLFIVLHHNATSSDPQTQGLDSEPILYVYGWKDSCAIFFYFLIAIVMHAILQEYVLDKMNRKLHLSKVKHSKFNESGQLLAFYLVSVLWGGDIIFRDRLLVYVWGLWEGYPHALLPFMSKFFFLTQISYWLHCFPELYFQRVKREEWLSKIQLPILHLAFIIPAYLLNFTRVATCLLVLHYISESLFNGARLLHFSGRTKTSAEVFLGANVLFLVVRLLSIILSVLTFWYGLALGPQEGWDFNKGSFNTTLVRLNCLLAVCLLQAWLLWNFLTFHLQRRRERLAEQQALAKKKDGGQVKKEKGKKKKDESKRTGSEEDVSELPEVDQNTKKNLKSRSAKVK